MLTLYHCNDSCFMKFILNIFCLLQTIGSSINILITCTSLPFFFCHINVGGNFFMCLPVYRFSIQIILIWWDVAKENICNLVHVIRMFMDEAIVYRKQNKLLRSCIVGSTLPWRHDCQLIYAIYNCVHNHFISKHLELWSSIYHVKFTLATLLCPC